MAATGIILLVFLILHLISFFLDARFGLDIGLGIDMSQFDYTAIGTEDHASLWHKSAAQMSVEWYSAIYVIAMAIVGFHLNHGFQSAFQTLGIRHAKYTPLIKKAGTAFAIVVPAAFAAIPIYFVILKHSGKLAEYFIMPYGF